MRWCECGRRRGRGKRACDRCLALDGHTLMEANMIGTFRILDGRHTAETLATAAGMTRRNVLRALRPLIQNGRVARSQMAAELSGGDKAVAMFNLTLG